MTIPEECLNRPGKKHAHPARRGTAALRSDGSRPAGAPGSRALAGIAIGVVLLVMAGSLSPFTFTLATGRAPHGPSLSAIGWPASDLHDLLTNLAVYLPVGVAVAACLRRRMPALATVVLTGLAGGSAALLAECLQTCIPVRSPSWWDVMVNVMGTLCGALLAGPALWLAEWTFQRAARAAARKPMTSLATALMAGLFVTGLAPFDLVTNTGELHASLAASRWIPLPGGTASAATGPATPAAHADLAAWGFAGVFFALGFFLALAGRENGSPRRIAWESAIGHAALLAVLIEAMHWFVISRCFQGRDVVLEVIAAALGAHLAIYAVDQPARSGWLGRPGLVLQPVLLLPALLVQAGYHLLSAVVSSGFRPCLTGVSPAPWIPFAGYYGRSLIEVGSHFVVLGAGAAMMAITVVLLVRRLDHRTRWFLAGASVVLVAIAGQGLRFLAAGGAVDPADPLIAAAAVAGAALVYEAIRRAARSYRTATRLQPVTA